MQAAARAARLVAQALRAAPARGRGCTTSASAAAMQEGDSRVVAYALGAFGALPFLAGTPAGCELMRDVAKSTGHTLPVRRPAQRTPPAAPHATRRGLRRSRWIAPRSCRPGMAAVSCRSWARRIGGSP